MTRKTTWTNSDGLVVGFGPNYAERNDAAARQDGVSKVAKVSVEGANSTFGASGAKVSLPAGSIVKNVYAKVTETFAGGTSITLGDATDPDGYILAASWANPAAGTVIQGDGAYAAATGNQLVPKEYASATDLYFTKVGTYTAGKADVFVEYV